MPHPAARFGNVDVLVIVSLVSLTVLLHLSMPGLIPSGADGGNWLAIARERSGTDVMAAAVAYPPLFPILVLLGLSVLGPVPSLVVAALLAKSLLLLAIYLCCRPVGKWYALGAAVCSGVAGAQLEAYAWGGYPQLMGTAFALVTVFLGMRWLADNMRSYLVLTVVFGALTFLTHSLMAGLLIVAFPLAAVHWVLLSKAWRAEWRRAAVLVLLLVVPGGLYVLLSTLAGSEAGVTAVLNPYEIPLLQSIQLSVRDAFVVWFVVGLLGLAGLAVRELHGPRAATLATGSSWVLAGSVFFLVTGEARGLLLTQIGLIILASLSLRRIFQKVRRKDFQVSKSRARIAFPVTATLVVSMVSALIAGGLVTYQAAIAWYRVADEDVLEALDWLNENSNPNDLMVASSGPNGNPLGWWVQGYGERRTFTGIDVRALSFPDERAQAEIANEIFDESTSESRTRSLISTHGIDFLIVDRRGSDAHWLTGDVAQSFEELYDSPSITVLGVRTS